MRLGHPKISKQPYDMPTYLRSQFNRGFCNVDIEIPIDPSTAVVCDERPQVAPSINNHNQISSRTIQRCY